MLLKCTFRRLGILQSQQARKNQQEIETAAALSNLGILEFVDGRFEDAKKLLEEALALRRPWLHKKKPEGETSYESMETVAVSLCKDHRFCRAPEDQRVLAKELKEHGQLDAVIADTINNLAACLEVLGQLEEARPLYEESLQLRKIVHGEYSLKVAESMQNLATVLDSQGHLKEAEELLEKSLAIQMELAGENSPEAAVSMNNLGVLCTHLGRLDKAQRLLEQAVATRVLFYGDDHQLTISARRNLEYVKNRKRSLAERPMSENIHVAT